MFRPVQDYSVFFSNVRLPRGLLPTGTDRSSAGCFVSFCPPGVRGAERLSDIPYLRRSSVEIMGKRDAYKV
jgi:hypothetical protein